MRDNWKDEKGIVEADAKKLDDWDDEDDGRLEEFIGD